MSFGICYNFLLKLDILSNIVATLDYDHHHHPTPTLHPPRQLFLLLLFCLLVCLVIYPDLRWTIPYPLRYVATDGSAQLGFVKSEVAPVSAQLSGQR